MKKAGVGGRRRRRRNIAGLHIHRDRVASSVRVLIIKSQASQHGNLPSPPQTDLTIISHPAPDIPEILLT
jgi:hypothetical protein